MSSANSRILTDRGVSQAESWAVVACCTVASMAAIVWSWRHDAMLNYGDAVAHLHIARRVFDSRTPRFSQLGSVWLPLPHILLVPFVQDYQWWATGLAGVIPSALAYITACTGLYRLVRHFASAAAAALALAFFALNPNLLYIQTTAMTEPLFLCEMIWIVVWMVEWRDALNVEAEAARRNLHPGPPVPAGRLSRLGASIQESSRVAASTAPRRRGAWLSNPTARHTPWRDIFGAPSSRLQALIAAGLIAAIFTRYDGWIIALIAWSGMGLALWSHRRLSSPAYWLLSIAVAAAPMLWFKYNSVCFGDWLYFARGPFSAKAIELRTSTSGAWPPHPGWHDPWVAFLFYLKVSLLDSVTATGWRNALGNLILALAALGSITAGIVQRSGTSRRAFAWILLLWLPVPFYAWSVAYGSVPIFSPAWWPYTFYNTRYGLELLPALAVGVGLAAHVAVRALHRLISSRFSFHFLDRFHVAPLLAGLAFAVFFALAVINQVQLLRAGPLVYVESTKNLEARLSYDEAIPPVLQDLLSFLPRAPVLINTSAYPEIVALTGIPLRQTINESDLEIFRAALASPAASAAVIVAYDGDEVDRAVKAHPADLAIAGRFTANTQPPATIYFSSRWLEQSPLMKLPTTKSPLMKDLLPPATDADPASPTR
jgi:hypothetical protein